MHWAAQIKWRLSAALAVTLEKQTNRREKRPIKKSRLDYSNVLLIRMICKPGFEMPRPLSLPMHLTTWFPLYVHFDFYFHTLRRPCLQTCVYVYCDRYILYIYTRMFPFALFLPLPQHTPYTSAMRNTQKTFLRRTKWREIVTVRNLLHQIAQKWQRMRKHEREQAVSSSYLLKTGSFLMKDCFSVWKLESQLRLAQGTGSRCAQLTPTVFFRIFSVSNVLYELIECIIVNPKVIQRKQAVAVTTTYVCMPVFDTSRGLRCIFEDFYS